MKHYFQYGSYDLFKLRESLSGVSKTNFRVKLAANFHWDKIEKEYNKRLRNSQNNTLTHVE